MFQSKNSRNWSSTAREEPAARRINDVNPRNGSATSLANSQFSPLLSPIPPPRPALPPRKPPSLCLVVSAPSLLEYPCPLFRSGPIPTRPEPQARPSHRTFALSRRPVRPLCRARRLYALTTSLSYPSRWSFVSVTDLSSHASSSASASVVSFPGHPAPGIPK